MSPIRDKSEQYMNQWVPRTVVLDSPPLVKKDGGNNGNGKYCERDDDDDCPSIAVVTKTAWTQITNTAWTTQTVTACTTQTAIATSSSVMSAVVTTPTSTSKSFASTSIPITSAITSMPTTGAYTAFNIPSSEQPGRKGLCTLLNGDLCATAPAYEGISAPTAQLDQASSLPSIIPPHFEKFHNDDDDDLSPLAEKLLITAGSIAILVIFGAIIYLIIRMKKLNRLARGDIVEEEARWYGWRRNRDDPGPPIYVSGKMSQNEYPKDEKFTEREMAGFYNPDNKVPLERPGSATVNLRELRKDLQRQNSTRNSPVADPGQSYGPQSNAGFYYSQSESLRSQQSALSGQSGQSSNAYDHSQRDFHRISYLSSISSGFGDSLAMPNDSAPQIPVSRFSWTTASQGAPQNRDTIYTTTSEETAPRFRTVNSWVAQQTGRVERKKQSDLEIPAMPELPIEFAHRSQIPDPLFVKKLQGEAGEDPAFSHHPGDEIKFGRGSRVSSAILDGKIRF
ncbi:hypothetical protein NHQ30_001990 [Ciborinia camelliae]|nr:hypothetical protein NHQ30_001990 [Ciborinia camelliae]